MHIEQTIRDLMHVMQTYLTEAECMQKAQTPAQPEHLERMSSLCSSMALALADLQQAVQLERKQEVIVGEEPASPVALPVKQGHYEVGTTVIYRRVPCIVERFIPESAVPTHCKLENRGAAYNLYILRSGTTKKCYAWECLLDAENGAATQSLAQESLIND